MKEIVVNLNFDDFHPQTDEEGDFGGDLESGNFQYLVRLWQEFPGLKITLFTTPNWIDRPFEKPSWYYHMRKRLAVQPVVPCRKDEPFRLDKHPAWCEKVRKLINEEKLEVAVHGYYHHNPRQVIHGQEFIDLDYQESKKRILAAEEIFQKCDLPFLKIFRPPGWGTSPELFRALRELKYEGVGLFPSRLKQISLTTVEGLKIIPQNYSILEQPSRALKQAEETGLVFAKGHMAYQYGRERIENGLSEKTFANIKNTLRELQKKFQVRYSSIAFPVSSEV